jgi:hypothetical protein
MNAAISSLPISPSARAVEPSAVMLRTTCLI